MALWDVQIQVLIKLYLNESTDIEKRNGKRRQTEQS